MAQVFLDIDGVLANWCDGFIKAFGAQDIYEPLIKNGEFCKFDEDKNFRYYSKNYVKFDQYINKDREFTQKTINDLGESFWLELDLLPWANFVYEWLSARHCVYLLSNPGFFDNSRSAKFKWVKKNFGDFAARRMVLARDKELVGDQYSILIDDLKYNCKDYLKSGKHALLFPNQFHLSSLEGPVILFLEGVFCEFFEKYEEIKNDPHRILNLILSEGVKENSESSVDLVRLLSDERRKSRELETLCNNLVKLNVDNVKDISKALNKMKRDQLKINFDDIRKKYE